MQSGSNSLKQFVLQNRWLLLAATLAAIAFRVSFLLKFRMLTDDSYIYGEIARTWLQQHVFGQWFQNAPEPTFIRLPGYPLFLIIVWLIAGVEHYTAVLIAQVAVDVATCFVVADLARRIASDRVARVAFVLAAFCPFFANYSAAVLTETLAIFFSALALDAAVAAFDDPSRKSRWILCGIALAAGILLRPDGGILLAIVGLFALAYAAQFHSRQILIGAVLTGVIALAPLVPWTIRNWLTFHVFQPLTPQSASMPWEFVPTGFQRWTRTWIADYASVEDIWFNVDGGEIKVSDLPSRAFDTPEQRAITEALFAIYNENGNHVSRSLDAQFAALADERIHAHPLRYYVGLPLLRAAGLWLRPRTEMLPIDPHWWKLREDDPPQFRWSIFLSALNLLYVVAAIMGLKNVKYAALFVAFAIARTAFLAWMPNPEPRYVLECYPALLAIAAAWNPKKA